MPALTFTFDEEKAVETLCFIAERWPGLTTFHLGKVLYFAEREHLNRYGRPIFGDTYIAMDNGPVPSATYDFVKGRLRRFTDAGAFTSALSVEAQGGLRSVYARRAPDLDALSDTDIECLELAIGKCRDRSFGSLSDETHAHRAWAETPQDAAIDYAMMVDGPEAEAVLEEAREYAAYGVS